MKDNNKKKKIKVKNTVPDLLAAVTNHEDCPEWLKSKIYNTLADNSTIPADCAEMYGAMLKYTTLPKDVECNNYEVIQ